MPLSRKVGIVGNGSDKFTETGKNRAKDLIYDILSMESSPVVVSGHSPVGGVDIWAEDIAEELGLKTDIKIPEINQWNPRGYGYKARNLDIAESDIVHVIVARDYPPNYEGMRFDLCYHCKTKDHVKSGGCWTGKQALKKGNNAVWHFIDNE